MDRERREAERDDRRRETAYYRYDGITRVLTQQTPEEALASFAADIQRAVDAMAPKTLSEIQAEQQAAAKARQQEEIEARLERGDTPCWLCLRDNDIVAFHPCKEKTCPQAPIAYTRFDRWGYPNTAYPAHPLREYYSAPGMPSHSNNYYRRAFREYDEEQARQRQREAKALKEAEELTGLKGDAAKAEYERRRQAPQHGLADFLDVSGGLVDPPKPAAKKGPKKPTVEKFPLDDI
jgi:hypothetical protein